MEILSHHVSELRLFLGGVPENKWKEQLERQAMNFGRRKIVDTGEPAYPNLQTIERQRSYAQIGLRMYKAILANDFTELPDDKADEKCMACGNLEKTGCRLNGRTISLR